MPTTAGTGSEVGRAGVITNLATHTKKVIFHPRMLPAQVILDPELTVGLPPALTAGTGMDALAHCLEAYASPAYHPMAEGIAVEGIRLVKDYLPRAYRDGARPRGPRQHAGRRRDGRRPPSRRASAPSTRSRTRSARSTTPTTA